MPIDSSKSTNGGGGGGGMPRAGFMAPDSPAHLLQPIDQDPTLFRPRAADLSGGAQARFAAEVVEVVVVGRIPSGLAGTFYRVGADPIYPPTYHSPTGEGFHPVDGDGLVSALRIHGGHADFKQRWVETERLKLERKAGRALFGVYRNPFTHHPCVRQAIDATGNTHVLLHAGKLLALSERGAPYEIDPNTLDTLSYNPFGKLCKSKTFSAHCKADPATGELVTWGYEAKGLATRDICAWSIGADGKLTEEIWFKQSDDCRAIHDGGIVLQAWPMVADLAQMKAGGAHLRWDVSLGTKFILIPRHGKDLSQVKEFNYPVNCMTTHVGACFEKDGKVYIDSNRTSDKTWFKAQDGVEYKGEKAVDADYVRFVLDPLAPTGSEVPEPEVLHPLACEWPRIDERFQCRDNRYSYIATYMEGSKPLGPGPYEVTNGICRIDHTTGKKIYYSPSPRCKFGEPVFINRHEGAAEGDGWTLAPYEYIDEFRTEYAILDSADEWARPVALLKLPFRLRNLIHGSWIPEDTIPGGYKPLITCPAPGPCSKEGPWDFGADAPNFVE